MLFSTLSLLTSVAAVSAIALPSSFSSPAPIKRAGGSISVTPHDRFSSSLGVLGYWPEQRGCDNFCVKVTANGRSVTLLAIDHSGGAHDISYDAWNYLVTGQSATENPTMGGGIPATYEDVPMSECADLITEPSGRLAFSAVTSMNTVSNCLSNPWFASNYVLYNIYNQQCTWGHDEVCVLPPPSEGNQAKCGHTLGDQAPLTSQPVYNLDYGTGKPSLAI